jgi:hypothetical protein
MPRAPLTEEQKQVLRDRLARARDARSKKAADRKTDKASAPSVLPTSPVHFSPYVPWTEGIWMSAPIDACRTRLALLKRDFELGSRITGQRPDVNDPSTYRCFVCHKAVPERAPSGQGSGWVWKHDYLDPLTGLFKSVVIDTQSCHMVYINDTRLQQTLKDLIAGKVAASVEDVKKSKVAS